MNKMLASLVIVMLMLTGCTIGFNQENKSVVSEYSNKSSNKIEKTISKSSSNDEKTKSSSGNIMERFPQKIILKENHTEKMNVFGMDMKKKGEKHQISINKFILNVGENIVAKKYKKQYVGNKIIIETEDGSIKYEVVNLYEGDSYIIESNNELSEEYDKIRNDYNSRNKDSEDFLQSEQLLTFLQQHKELLPDLFFADVKQRFEILKSTFKVDKNFKDVEAPDGYNRSSDFTKYTSCKFNENGYNNIMYLCRNKLGIYAIRTTYKEGCSVRYPEYEIEIE